MNGVMKEAIAEPRETVNEYAPKIDYMQIDPEKIGEVVGQRGKTINEIIKRTGVQIDIEDDGSVSICGNDAKGMELAKKYINTIVSEFEEQSSASRNSVPLSSSRPARKVWFTSPRSRTAASSMSRMF